MRVDDVYGNICLKRELDGIFVEIVLDDESWHVGGPFATLREAQTIANSFADRLITAIARAWHLGTTVH